MKPITFLLVAITTVFAAATLSTAAAEKPGGGVWKPIPNPKAYYVWEIAQFAVQTHNRLRRNVHVEPRLEVTSVESGEYQVVKGEYRSVNYRLNVKVVEVYKPFSPVLYRTEVHKTGGGGIKKLQYFSPIFNGLD